MRCWFNNVEQKYEKNESDEFKMILGFNNDSFGKKMVTIGRFDIIDGFKYLLTVESNFDRFVLFISYTQYEPKKWHEH